MGRQVTLSTGPWSRVYNLPSAPESVKQETLYSATNMVFPIDAAAPFARPPFVETKAGGTLGSVGARYGQGIYEHVATDGTRTRFFFVGGKVYRWDGTSTFTDVTPATPTISTTSRIYCASLGDKLIVTDGVNKPWMGTNLSSTPITGTNIEVDSTPHSWSAYGAPTVYAAKLFFILNSINGVSYRNAIVWSEEADPATGYQQNSYDNTWELTQAGTDALHAIVGTNSALYYFRQRSIGLIAGQVDSTFQTTATVDAVSSSIGTRTPAAVCVAGNAIWFLDERNYMHRLPFDGTPEPVWVQATDDLLFNLQNHTTASITAAAVAAYVPDLDVVVIGNGGSTSTDSDAWGLYVFGATNGHYMGRWLLDSNEFQSLASISNADGRVCLMALTTSGGGGAVCRLRAMAEMEAGTDYADFGVSSVVPRASIVTHALGMGRNSSWVFDRVILDLTGTTFGSTDVGTNMVITTPQERSTTATAYSRSGLIGSTTRGPARAEWGVSRTGRYAQLGFSVTQPTVDAWPCFQPLRAAVVAMPIPTYADEF